VTHTLQALPTWLLGVLIIGGAASLSVGGMLLVRQRLPSAVTEGHNDVVGAMYSLVGTMYSIFLAFLVFIVWEQYNAAGSAVANEAATLDSLYQSTTFLPAPIRHEARSELATYTTLVITREWNTMVNGTASEDASNALDRLYRTYSRLGTMPGEQATSTVSAGLLDRLTTQRTQRIQTSGGALNGVFWVIVLFGAAVTVAFSFLFYLENALLQGIMVASATALIAALLFLLLLVDHPFSGDFYVTREPFQTVLQHMRHV
jgi:hypothetical protein